MQENVPQQAPKPITYDSKKTPNDPFKSKLCKAVRLNAMIVILSATYLGRVAGS